MTEDNIPTMDTTASGLDRLADDLAAEWQLSAEGRDRLRAKLADFEDVRFDPEHGVPVKLCRHEVIGDWQRATLRPFLRVVPH